MERFPYITDDINRLFAEEKTRWDFILLRPILLVTYFFLRCLSFPVQFLIHRFPIGFEGKLIDLILAFGIKYVARGDAIELLIRHVQIEPILYRHVLSTPDGAEGGAAAKLNGIDGDFNVDSLSTMIRHNLTVGHDKLSYELVDRFDKATFLAHLDYVRARIPEDHEQLSKGILEENRRHSLNLLGPTCLVMLIVSTITVVGDLRTTVTALNSFGSDSILLWCMKHLYKDDFAAQCDLDFFMQEGANRGHYNSSAFFSNPSQYLYYHIVFNEVAYDMLRNRPPIVKDSKTP